MRNYIVYFLTSLFLLFVVESKINVRTLNDRPAGQVSHHQNTPKRANRLNQTCDKLSLQQMPNDTANLYSLELAENSFQVNDTLQELVFFTSIFTLAYIFGLTSFKKAKPALAGYLCRFFAVKRFILIRSIRI